MPERGSRSKGGVNAALLAPVVTGVLIGLLLIGLAAWLLLLPPAGSGTELRLYAMLAGAYGIWRLVRAGLQWREREGPH